MSPLTINDAPIGYYNGWTSFMGSVVMLTGDERIDAYYLRVRREMQSSPVCNDILNIPEPAHERSE